MTIEELKEWRKRNQVTQKQLAEMLKTTTVSIGRWETGIHPIPSFLDLALAELERRLTANRKEVTRDGSKNPRKKTR
jgi:transcriptional regulator with XRE-family HTH domain